MRTPLLAVEDLHVWFELPGGGELHAVRGAGFEVEAGERFGLVGESGCGKTTAMLSIMGLLPPNASLAGEVRLDGENILARGEESVSPHRWNDIAMVFQGAMNAFNPVQTVGSQIEEPMHLHGVAEGKVARRQSEELLERVGIPKDRADRFPHEFSGGMRQRAVEDVGHRRLLLDAAGIHDGELVRLLRYHAEVVRDEEERHAMALAELAQQLEDLRLDGDVEGRRRLVRDEDARLAGDRDGDHDALAHAARELMRVVVRTPCGLGDPHLLQQRRRALPRLAAAHAAVQAERFCDLAPDREHGVQRGHRLLEHHRQPGPAELTHPALRQREQVLAVEQYASAGDVPRRRHEAHQRQRRHALPAARLADEAEHASRVERERHVVDGVHAPAVQREHRLQIAHLEEGHQPGRGVPAASSGSTRSAGGGAKSAAATSGLSSTASYWSRTGSPRCGDSTSSTRGKPSSWSPKLTRRTTPSPRSSSARTTSSVEGANQMRCSPPLSGSVRRCPSGVAVTEGGPVATRAGGTPRRMSTTSPSASGAPSSRTRFCGVAPPS
jgi:ABC-type lipoprotein export system ATPase subunit